MANKKQSMDMDKTHSTLSLFCIIFSFLPPAMFVFGTCAGAAAPNMFASRSTLPMMFLPLSLSLSLLVCLSVALWLQPPFEDTRSCSLKHFL